MKRQDLNRRDFNKYTAAAFGGIIAGSTFGCNSGEDASGPAEPAGTPEVDDTAGMDAGADADHDVSLLLAEPHTCRGLNSCKGQGAGKENDCAGMGTCATVAKHDCGTTNDCKGQGGCGEFPGQNLCKGQGGCQIPLMEEAWKSAREAFAKAYQEKHGKEIGAAPAAKGEG